MRKHAKRNFTDKYLASLRPPAVGRDDWYDAQVPGLLVRITSKGSRSYMYRMRVPSPKTGKLQPSRRRIGLVGAMSIDAARAVARSWYEQIRQGKDPKAEEKRERRERQRQESNTFASVAAAYIKHLRSRGVRKAKTYEREINKELVSRFGGRSISDITVLDIREAVEVIKQRGSHTQAHEILQRARSLYFWAIGTAAYGLTVNPCTFIKPSQLIGPKKHRTRVLSPAEIKALWDAVEQEHEPWRSLYQMLMLTGARLSEVADMKHGELDLDGALWTIPAGRHKSQAPYAVPLTSRMVDLLRATRKWEGGDFVFSAIGNFGRSPVKNFSKPKRRLDERMGFKDWRVHDIRRSVRTQLAVLGISSHIAERVIGHDVRSKIERTYNQHLYRNEILAALNAWDARLHQIVTGEAPGDNVVKLRG